MDTQSDRVLGTAPHGSLRGQVVYIRAFDIAYDMKRERLRELLGQPASEYSVGPSRRSPKQWFFYRPDIVHLPVIERQGPQGPVRIEQVIKVFHIGAISIQIRVPFEVRAIEELVSLYELKIEGRNLDGEFNDLAEEVTRELEPFCIRPVSQLARGEGHTVFCLHEVPGVVDETGNRAENWLLANRREIGGLLSREQDAGRLSEQEINESTERYLTYYDDDLAVMDWDACLVIGEQSSLDEVIHVVELANVQLLELGVYDRILDVSLERAYHDLERPGVILRRQVQRSLRGIRVDLARLSDELLNTTKFLGDWHLARIYQALSGRLHLADWHSIISVKLKTLGELYQFLNQDRINFWVVVLEATIVLLFVIDVLLLIVSSH